MARIHDAPVEQYAPLYGDDAGEFHRVMAHRAPLEAGLAGFQHAADPFALGRAHRA